MVDLLYILFCGPYPDIDSEHLAHHWNNIFCVNDQVAIVIAFHLPNCLTGVCHHFAGGFSCGISFHIVLFSRSQGCLVVDICFLSNQHHSCLSGLEVLSWEKDRSEAWPTAISFTQVPSLHCTGFVAVSIVTWFFIQEYKWIQKSRLGDNIACLPSTMNWSARLLDCFLHESWDLSPHCWSTEV